MAKTADQSSKVARAVIGRQLFGNPIPEAWYAACRDYESRKLDGWNPIEASVVASLYFRNAYEADLCHMGLYDLFESYERRFI